MELPKPKPSIYLVILFAASQLGLAEGWCGLKVEPEKSCSTYDRRDYSYPASIERRIAEREGYLVDRAGKINRPYHLPYTADVVCEERSAILDIEHRVACREAHDSGLCAATRATRRAFARDLDNLTLSLPSVNRWDKSDKDAADWIPEINRREFAEAVVLTKRKYGLSVDAAERDVLALQLNMSRVCEKLETPMNQYSSKTYRAQLILAGRSHSDRQDFKPAHHGSG